MCVAIGSGCIKNCPSGSDQERCIDFCIAEESQCMSRARIDVIGSETTIGGGGVAVQTP